MTKEQMAELLNGREYCDEMTDAEEKLAEMAAALDDALIVNCLPPVGPDESPADAIKRLIDWEVKIALDPAVSELARKLKDEGAAEVLEAEAEEWETEEGLECGCDHVAQELRRVALAIRSSASKRREIDK